MCEIEGEEVAIIGDPEDMPSRHYFFSNLSDRELLRKIESKEVLESLGFELLREAVERLLIKKIVEDENE